MTPIFKRMLSGLLCLSLMLCLLPVLEQETDAAGYSNGYTGTMAGNGKIFAHGLDVSAWQESGLNFQNFANAGYDFVILRCGTSYGKDRCFEEYYANARKAGLDVGCYYYSYATTPAAAAAEAADMISWMGGKSFEYPIYYDFEDPCQSNLSGSVAASICRAFMDKIKAAGYLPGLYSMASWLEKDWVTSSGIRNDYEGWVAHLPSMDNNTGITSTAHQVLLSKYASRYGMHQYSFTTYVNGVGPFDANVAFKDYPAITKKYGFNNYDEQNPVISDVRYSDVSAAGYTISCKVTDSSGISRVAFPTWTVNKAQDDLAANWMETQQGTKNGDTYTFRVNTSDHNNEKGLYVTHIYAEDRNGNIGKLQPDAVEVRNDTKNPVISDVVYSNVSAAGYTISCKVTDDWGVNNVSFPTWTTANAQDDLIPNWPTTQRGTKNGDTYTFRVNASDHNNEGGMYATHIYATDCAGHTVSLPLNPVEVRNDTKAPEIYDAKISNVTASGYTVTCKVKDDWGLNSVAFPTWTVAGGQDDLAAQFMETQKGQDIDGTYTFYVKASDHNHEGGYYATHIYARDCAGNTTSLALNAVELKDPVKKILLAASSQYVSDGTYVTKVPRKTTVKTLLAQFENEVLEVVSCTGKVITGNSIVGTGAAINLYEGGKLIDSVTVVVAGDVDGNGSVDNTDYMRVKSAFLGNFTLNRVEQLAADMDGSTVVDNTDYMRIKASFLGAF